MFKKTLIVLFCFVCVLSIIGGCNCPCSKLTCNCSKIAYKSDSGKVINLTVGQLVCIRLEENRTTGYSWEYNCSNSKTCKLEKDIFLAPTGNLSGAPGMREFIIKAKSAGETKITLKYIRPWEKDQKPAEVMNYEIVVK